MPDSETTSDTSRANKRASSAVVPLGTPERVSTYLDAQEASLRSDRHAEQTKADQHSTQAEIHGGMTTQDGRQCARAAELVLFHRRQAHDSRARRWMRCGFPSSCRGVWRTLGNGRTDRR
jgi:hypothetical protein